MLKVMNTQTANGRLSTCHVQQEHQQKKSKKKRTCYCSSLLASKSMNETVKLLPIELGAYHTLPLGSGLGRFFLFPVSCTDTDAHHRTVASTGATPVSGETKRDVYGDESLSGGLHTFPPFPFVYFTPSIKLFRRAGTRH